MSMLSLISCSIYSIKLLIKKFLLLINPSFSLPLARDCLKTHLWGCLKSPNSRIVIPAHAGISFGIQTIIFEKLILITFWTASAEF